ncbi:MAG: hypothetical protein A2Z20_03925 [Bdellovibrionales bacterium RBG_16_40_8]|nr:MAG: hypothetical protein A2Z20_03925 [Bdellovibrionales bacterium RBG_16_40_8]
MLLEFIRESIPGLPARMYRIAHGEWPSSVSDCTGWIITGSSKNTIDKDLWILKLSQFIQECHRQKHQLVGICFGHQIIAQALGGRVDQSRLGWGVGAHTFSVTTQKPWMTPFRSKITLFFSHRYQVMQLPREATLIAKNDFCPIQMYMVNQHIFCMQGHPEFTAEFTKSRMKSRIDELGKELYKSAKKTLIQPSNSKIIASWIKNFLTRSF